MAKIEKVLADCLEAMEQGTSLDGCLARHPEQREALEPLLRAAQRVHSAPVIGPSDRFRSGARERMMLLLQHRELVEDTRDRTKRGGLVQRLRSRSVTLPRMRTLAMQAGALVCAILVISLVGVGAAHASSDSLPGDLLYPVKIASERIQLAFSVTENAEARLHLRLAGERLEEATALLRRGDSQDIEGLMRRYAAEVEAASGILRRQRDRDSQVSALRAELEEQLSQHQSVLDQVREDVPEPARAAVEQAMAASKVAKEHVFGPEGKPQTPWAPQPTRTAEGGEPITRTRSARQAQPTGTLLPPGWTMTPEAPGLTMTPQPPGLTYTPEPPGQTWTPQPPGQTWTPQPPGQTWTAQPPGQTWTPEPPGLTWTPEPPGLTWTPEPPGQTRTPRAPGPSVTPEPPDPSDPSDPPGPPDPPDPPGPPDSPGPPGGEEEAEPPGQDDTPGRP